MRPVQAIAAIALVCCAGLAEAKTRRQRREEARLDSIRIADSLRVADSIRIADSLMMARYRSADQRLKKAKQEETERKKRLQELRREAARQQEDSTGDAVAAREIVLPPDSREARIVDSLESVIHSREQRLYQDAEFGKSRDYSLPETIRYCRYLLKHAKRDLEQVTGFIEEKHALLSMELRKLNILMDTQEGNNRAFLLLHVKRVKEDLSYLSGFLVTLSQYDRPEIAHEK